jgi:tRNA (guanine-N(7)-)-methyltransferase
MKHRFGTIIDNLKQGLELPASHENPYLTQSLEFSDYLFTQQELASKKADHPLVVEIGCYMGKTIIELAQANKNIHFLGLDITYKRVVKSAKKLKNNQIQNGKIAICDGNYFLRNIADNQSLSGICVFFPDPWSKEKQKKNRLLNQDFISLAHQKLNQKGFFWFKTDCQEYFLTAQDLILKSGFIADDSAPNVPLEQPRNILGGPFETQFQKLFSSKNVPFYQRVYLKHDDA